MPRALVLGQPIAHSLSPVLHNAGYAAAGLDDWSYDRHEVNAEGLAAYIRAAGEDVCGFSVTMPCKFAALDFADTATRRAELMGSANTLVRQDDGWLADNTDTEGVLGALQELRAEGERALLIGSGGTARPALWALAELGFRHVDILNRSNRLSELSGLIEALGLEVSYHQLAPDNRAEVESLAVAADVIVSTAPSRAVADLLPQLAHAPLLDVIYDPLPTALMIHAGANGYRTVGGHVMLAHQSYSQFEQFTGVSAPREAMRSALFEKLGLRAD